MKQFKRVMAILLSLVMLITSAPIEGFASEVAVAEGDNGELTAGGASKDILDERFAIEDAFDYEAFLASYDNLADTVDYATCLAYMYTLPTSIDTINDSMEEATLSGSMVETISGNAAFTVAYATWEGANLVSDPIGMITNDYLNKTTYFETIIYKLLEAQYSQDTAVDWITQKNITSTIKLTKNLNELAQEDYYAFINSTHNIADLTSEQKAAMEAWAKNYLEDNTTVSSDLEFVTTALEFADTVETYIENIATYIQFSETNQATIDFLESMLQYADDTYLRQALRNVIRVHEDMFSAMYKSAVSTGALFVGKQFVEHWQDTVIDKLMGGVFSDGAIIMNGIKIGNAIGKAIGNIVLSVDKQLDKYEMMRSLVIFENAAEGALAAQINAYDGTKEKATVIAAGAELLYATYVQDAKFAKEMAKLAESNWLGDVTEEDLEEFSTFANTLIEEYKAEFTSLTPYAGSCGTTANWVVLEDGSLLIVGSGQMYSYEAGEAPWYFLRDRIEKIYISSNITELGKNAFYGLPIGSNYPVVLANPNIGSLNRSGLCSQTPIIVDSDLTLVSTNYALYIRGSVSLVGSVEFKSNVVITEDLIYNKHSTASGMIDFLDGAHVFVLGNATFNMGGKKSLRKCHVYINPGATFHINGNLSMYGIGTNLNYDCVYFKNHGNLIIGGNCTIEGNSCIDHGGYFQGKDTSPYFLVKGSYTDVTSYYQYLTSGMAEFQGNCSTKLVSNGPSEVVLSGDSEQTVCFYSSPRTLIIDNRSGVMFTEKLNITTLFDHRGNPFELYNEGTGSSFVDYDGDGLKDHVDPQPTVGLPCTIYVVSSNEAHGTVSESVIETHGCATVTVSATPTFKYEFSKWVNSAGTTVSTDANYTFRVKAADTLTAVFTKRTQPIYTQTEGGTVNVASCAEIDSVVPISVQPDDGYTFEEGSLCYNGNPIIGGSFVMPDEEVYITATFRRNQAYFDLLEKIDEAATYTDEAYSTESFAALQAAIAAAQAALVNDITQQTSDAHIAALQNAIQGLEATKVTQLEVVYIPTIYAGVDGDIDMMEVVAVYDNGTSEFIHSYTLSGFDNDTPGEQTVCISYAGVETSVVINVERRKMSSAHVCAFIGDQCWSDEESPCTPEPEYVECAMTGQSLVNGVDFTITYTNNAAPGTATAVLTGIGHFEGTQEITFEITEHPYGDWIVETTPTQEEEGFRYRICTRCENILSETLPRVSALSLSEISFVHEETTRVNFRADKVLFEEVGYENPYVIVEFNGETTTLTEYTVSGDYYVFSFEGITEEQLGQTVKATLYATYEGVQYASAVEEYILPEHVDVAVTTPAGTEYFADLESAIQAYSSDSGHITLYTDTEEDVTVSKDICLDLNGYDITGAVTVAEGCTLYCMDTQTDDYTVADGNYGKLRAVQGSVAGYSVDGAVYMSVTEADGTSFHRVGMDIYSMTLRASQAGVYYNSTFKADEVAAQRVAQFGVALSVVAEPTAENMKKNCQRSVFTDFASAQESYTGTLLRWVMKSENLVSENRRNADMPVYGRAYVLTTDGQYLFGQTVSRSFRQQVEGVDAIWDTLTDVQKEEVRGLYMENLFIMKNWNVPNIREAFGTDSGDVSFDDLLQ